MEEQILYRQLQKRTAKLEITDKVIQSISRIKIPTFDAEENRKIQEVHKEVLRVAQRKNKSGEVGCLISMETWICRFIIGTENMVSITQDENSYHMVKGLPRNSLIFIHNHPRNTLFSEMDIRSFLKADNIWLMTVVCNNGRIHLLMKHPDFNSFSAEIGYNELLEHMSVVSAVKRFLRICSKYGLYYRYGGNTR